jgi:DNA invertase Pin-like site-specific DNA recombinase
MSTAVYLRVSSKTQRVDAQRHEIERYLAGHGITDAQWFIDHASGANTDRPALKQLQAAAFNGQVKTIVLYKLDRLARSIRDGINLLTGWLDAGVRVVVVTMQLDLSGALGQTVAALLLGLAQMEREAIRDRQAAGIAAARAKGKRWGGRRRGSYKADPTRVAELADKGLRPSEIATALGVSERTVYRVLHVLACG